MLLVHEFVKFGYRPRHPLRTRARIGGLVIIEPGCGSSTRKDTGSLMVLEDNVRQYIAKFLSPHRSALEAWCLNSAEECRSKNFFSRFESSAISGLSLAIPKFSFR